MEVTTGVSILVGAISALISIFAIWLAYSAKSESSANFEKAQRVLAEIDKRAAVTEEVVAEHQRELMDTVRQLVIPAKPDVGEMLGAKFLESIVQDPDRFMKMMPMLERFSERKQRDE